MCSLAANGECIASATSFITDFPEPIVRITRVNVQVDALCLLTDGLERLAMEILRGDHIDHFSAVCLRPLSSSKTIGRDSVYLGGSLNISTAVP